MIQLQKIIINSKLSRFYSQNKYKIHETLRKVDPFLNVKITCTSNATIRPIDLFDYPNANHLRILTFSKSADTKTEIDISGDEKNMAINEANNHKEEETKYIIEVPIKCNLKIRSQQNVSIFGLYSDFIDVKSKRDIFTKDLRSTNIGFHSECGNIRCDGLTLAQKINVETKSSGSIHLDKIQGDLLQCTSSEGAISANSCYAEVSKFVTEKGSLNLKNVHKKCTIYVLKEADINMTGIHGNVLIKSNGGNLNLQYSEIIDDNIVLTNDTKNVIINISDQVEESCFLDLHSDVITLSQSAHHLLNYLKDNSFRMGNSNCTNKLLVCTSGELTLGKLSWAESLKSSMGFKEL